MEFLIEKKTMTKMRLWLIQNGFIKPKNLKETREAFPFPNESDKNIQPPLNLWATNHIERKY